MSFLLLVSTHCLYTCCSNCSYLPQSTSATYTYIGVPARIAEEIARRKTFVDSGLGLRPAEPVSLTFSGLLRFRWFSLPRPLGIGLFVAVSVVDNGEESAYKVLISVCHSDTASAPLEGSGAVLLGDSGRWLLLLPESYLVSRVIPVTLAGNPLEIAQRQTSPEA